MRESQIDGLPKPYELFVRVEVARQWLPPITQEAEVIVQLPGYEPSINDPIKMEVGIED